MIISFDLFASLTGPVVQKAKRRRIAIEAAVEQQKLEAARAGGPPNMAHVFQCMLAAC